jgi:chromosome segregation ATPase
MPDSLDNSREYYREEEEKTNLFFELRKVKEGIDSLRAESELNYVGRVSKLADGLTTRLGEKMSELNKSLSEAQEKLFEQQLRTVREFEEKTQELSEKVLRETTTLEETRLAIEKLDKESLERSEGVKESLRQEYEAIRAEVAAQLRRDEELMQLHLKAMDELRSKTQEIGAEISGLQKLFDAISAEGSKQEARMQKVSELLGQAQTGITSTIQGIYSLSDSAKNQSKEFRESFASQLSEEKRLYEQIGARVSELAGNLLSLNRDVNAEVAGFKESLSGQLSEEKRAYAEIGARLLEVKDFVTALSSYSKQVSDAEGQRADKLATEVTALMAEIDEFKKASAEGQGKVVEEITVKINARFSELDSAVSAVREVFAAGQEKSLRELEDRVEESSNRLSAAQARIVEQQASSVKDFESRISALQNSLAEVHAGLVARQAQNVLDFESKLEAAIKAIAAQEAGIAERQETNLRAFEGSFKKFQENLEAHQAGIEERQEKGFVEFENRISALQEAIANRQIEIAKAQSSTLSEFQDKIGELSERIGGEAAVLAQTRDAIAELDRDGKARAENVQDRVMEEYEKLKNAIVEKLGEDTKLLDSHLNSLEAAGERSKLLLQSLFNLQEQLQGVSEEGRKSVERLSLVSGKLEELNASLDSIEKGIASLDKKTGEWKASEVIEAINASKTGLQSEMSVLSSEMQGLAKQVQAQSDSQKELVGKLATELMQLEAGVKKTSLDALESSSIAAREGIAEIAKQVQALRQEIAETARTTSEAQAAIARQSVQEAAETRRELEDLKSEGAARQVKLAEAISQGLSQKLSEMSQAISESHQVLIEPQKKAVDEFQNRVGELSQSVGGEAIALRETKQAIETLERTSANRAENVEGRLNFEYEKLKKIIGEQLRENETLLESHLESLEQASARSSGMAKAMVSLEEKIASMDALTDAKLNSLSEVTQKRLEELERLFAGMSVKAIEKEAFYDLARKIDSVYALVSRQGFSYAGGGGGQYAGGYSGGGQIMQSAPVEEPFDVSSFKPVVRLKVLEVTQGSAAEKAGVQKGMVLVSVDGKPIKSFNDFTARIADRARNQHSLYSDKGDKIDLPTEKEIGFEVAVMH